MQRITKKTHIQYDDYKESFYQKCTDEYTAKQVKNIEEVYVWLKNMLIVK